MYLIYFFCLMFAMSLCLSVYLCFVVTCWERADLLALVCGILGQVWYLIVLIPDLCTLTYFTSQSTVIIWSCRDGQFTQPYFFPGQA